MKSKKMFVKILLIGLIFISGIMCCNVSFATSCSKIENAAGTFKNAGEKELTQSNFEVNSVTEQVLPIYQMLLVAGIIIVGIAMLILGIQWVSAGASPDAQAKLKHKFVALAVTAGVLFGSFSIWKIIITVLDNID